MERTGGTQKPASLNGNAHPWPVSLPRPCQLLARHPLKDPGGGGTGSDPVLLTGRHADCFLQQLMPIMPWETGRQPKDNEEHG